MTVTDARDLRVLALGERRAAPQPLRGEVHGLRLAGGGALLGLVLHAHEQGLYAGASVMWVLNRRHTGCGIDVASASIGQPLLPPLVLHREVWTHGCAYRLGQLRPDHPLLCKRVVYRAQGRLFDLSDRPVDGPGASDVVAGCSLVFLRGLDERLRRTVSVAPRRPVRSVAASH